LPDPQDALVSAVVAANPHTIVVIYSGSSTFLVGKRIERGRKMG
jgi:hypothetical protein